MVSAFLDQLFRRGRAYSDLIGINRAFFAQGLLLVSVCRRLPDPERSSEQVKAFKDVCHAILVALQAGARQDAELNSKVKGNIAAKFKDAETALCKYIDEHNVSLNVIRGSKPGQDYGSEDLSSEMAKAMQSDGSASERLAAINASLAAKINVTKNMPTMEISIQFWPQILPECNPNARMAPPTFNPKDHTSLNYLRHDTFKVEKSTYIEMLLHRLLQASTIHGNNIRKLSLAQKPELYGSIPDDEKTPAPSLSPLSTVDAFVGKMLNITMEVKSRNITINIPTDHGKPLPADWTNIWVLDNGKSIMVRRNDDNSSLYKYSLELRPSKMRIPDSSSASHHVSGDMRLVGRNQKTKETGGFLSRLKGVLGLST